MAELRAMPIWQILASNLNLAAGWKIYTYEAGSAGDPAYEKSTYQDTAGSTPHTNPIIMDARGDKTIYWSGNYYLKITDENDVTIWTLDNFGASSSTTSQDINGSFELDSDGDGIPDNWTLTAYTGATFARASTKQDDGGYSLRADDAGNGGGVALSDIFRYCTPAQDIGVEWALICSSATTRQLLEIYWYDEAQAQLAGGSASTTLYDASSGNPTTWTKYYYTTTPPAGAYYYKIRITLCHASAAANGAWAAADSVWAGPPEVRHILSTIGDIIYASAANTPARKAIGSTGQVLQVSGGLPAWGDPELPISSLTAETAPEYGADYLPVYDNSAAANRKMLISDVVDSVPGSWVLVGRTTLVGGETSVTIAGLTNAYSKYKFRVHNLNYNSGTQYVFVQPTVAGTPITTNNSYGIARLSPGASPSWTLTGSAGLSAFDPYCPVVAGSPYRTTMDIEMVDCIGETTRVFYATCHVLGYVVTSIGHFLNANANTYDGVNFIPSVGTFQADEIFEVWGYKD